MKRAWLIWTSVSKRWLFFRLLYEFKRRSGWIQWRFPAAAYYKARESWAILPIHFPKALVSPAELRVQLENYPDHCKDVLKRAEAILALKIPYFSHHVHAFQGKIDWFYNPFLKKTEMRRGYWTQLENLDGKGNDIKVYWELSRFCWMIPVLQAYVLTQDQKYANFMADQMSDWIDQNPYLETTQWSCGQEIAFRLIIWTYILSYICPVLSEDHLEKFERHLYFSAKRIESNISYAVECVKNNHGLSEAAGLFTVGLLFPQFKESVQWKIKGQRIFEQELAWQVMADGGYCQHSFNYARLVSHLLLWMLRLETMSDQKLSPLVHEKARKMAELLAHFLEPGGKNQGRVSNFGANDGAWLFPFSSQGYGVFSPTVLALQIAARGGLIDLPHSHADELVWWGFSPESNLQMLARKNHFKEAGFCLLGNGAHHGFLRTAVSTKRAAQSDMLHVDLWMNGHNLICDLGTYSYNSIEPHSTAFFTSLNHNTISFGGEDHLNYVSRFLWVGLPITKHVSYSKTETFEQASATVEFRSGHVLTRDVFFYPETSLWVIRDQLPVLKAGEFWTLNWTIDGSFLKTEDPRLHRVMYPGGAARIWTSEPLLLTQFWKSNHYLKKDPVMQLKGRFAKQQVFFTVIDPNDTMSNLVVPSELMSV